MVSGGNDLEGGGVPEEKESKTEGEGGVVCGTEAGHADEAM